MNALDRMLFGNGHGMAAPGMSQTFYWLVSRDARGRTSAGFYSFLHGFGAQLYSWQWTHPKPGETRRIKEREFRPFCSRRVGPRVQVSWATPLPDDLNEKNAALRQLRADLSDSTVLDPQERREVAA